MFKIYLAYNIKTLSVYASYALYLHPEMIKEMPEAQTQGAKTTEASPMEDTQCETNIQKKRRH